MSPGTRLLRPFLQRQAPALGGALVATVVVTLADLAAPWPLKLVIDRLLGGERAAPFTLDVDDLWFLALVAGLVIAIAAVDAGGSYALDISLGRAGERITHDLRRATYAHLQRLSLAFHERQHTGDLVTRVTGDVNAVGSLFSESAGALVSSGLLLVGMLVVSAVLDPVVTLGIVLVVPPLTFVTLRYRTAIRGAARRQRAREGVIASLSTQTLASIRVVKAFGTESHEIRRIDEESEERRQAGVDTLRVQSRFGGAVDVVGAIGTAVVLVVGVFRVAAGAVTPGDLVVLASYARKVYRPLRDIARQTGKIAKAMARAERVAELLATDEFLDERPDARSVVRARGELVLDHVSFAYQADRPVLSDFSLRVPAGARVALVGPSGAGKSTVAALLARFYDPVSGRVLVDGSDAREWSLEWLRTQVGIVLQDSVLFTGTVADNIGYATDATRDEIVAAAKAAGIHGFITRLPQGYDTPLGPEARSLSRGQRQRLAIARTLLRDPAILLLDEPTLGLDADSEAHVVESLDVLMDRRTTVLITHAIALARTADHVVVLDGGRVIEQGTPEELLARPGRFRHLAAVQGLAARSSPPAPRDRALPRMGRVLDPDAMVPHLQRSLGRGRDATVTGAAVAYLRYKPQTNLVVHYQVDLDGSVHDAVVMIAAGADLARRVRKDAFQSLARQVDGRSPAVHPLVYDPDLDALMQWLPLDVWLPALAEHPQALQRRLGRLGVDVPCEEPLRLAYKPRRRAVLRLEDHVLKTYRAEADFAAAVAGLRVAARLGYDTRLEASCPELRLTAQPWLEGRPLALGEAVEAAGETLRRLHAAAPAAASRIHRPTAQLLAAMASMRMAATIHPELADRLDRLAARLQRRIPVGLPLVLSHGDFHHGQLLSGPAGPAIIDLDECCAAPPALDVANYAAHAVFGPEDVRSALELADRLAAGYGARPQELEWFLATAVLRRVWFPFRRFQPEWPAKVERLTTAAEALAP